MDFFLQSVHPSGDTANTAASGNTGSGKDVYRVLLKTTKKDGLRHL
jgi:hypothetical protein